ncbi:MFS transporter [Gaiella sp.]|uniref:MFS transporter n=1 Tax=Gaiella sp. TaxID=2663207 RepID=UPI003264A9D5
MPYASETRGVARYRELFGNRYAASLLAWSIVARLPNGMGALSLVLLVRATGAGYGEAGLVAAAYAVAVAVGAPYGGRQVDRRGAARILRRRLVLYSSLFGATAVLGAADAPIPVIAAFAAASGLTLAPISSVMRSIWPTVAGEDGARTAYALDAALQEVIFVGGPLLVAVLATFDPAAAVAGAAVIAAVGTFAFMRLPPVRASEPAEDRHLSRLGALSAVGVRTLALLSLCLGIGFGSAEIAIPAFAEAQGNRALAGVALAGFSCGSLLGGLVAALRPSRDDRRRIIIGTFLLAALLALPLLSGSVAAMTALFFVAGVPVAPVVAAIYGQIGRVAAAGSVAEAFSWFGTAISIGIAGGSVAGGWLIDTSDWRAAVVFGAALVAVGAVVVTIRWGTLAPPLGLARQPE